MSEQYFVISDCIAGCKKIVNDNSIDFVFADPPFNIDFDGEKCSAYTYGVSVDKNIYYEDMYFLL